MDYSHFLLRLAKSSLVVVEGLQKFGELLESIADCFIATIARDVELVEGMDNFVTLIRYANRESLRKSMERWGTKEARSTISEKSVLITKHLQDQGVGRHYLLKHRDVVKSNLSRMAKFFPPICDLLNLAEDLTENEGKVVNFHGIDGLVKAKVYKAPTNRIWPILGSDEEDEVEEERAEDREGTIAPPNSQEMPPFMDSQVMDDHFPASTQSTDEEEEVDDDEGGEKKKAKTAMKKTPRKKILKKQ